MVQTTNYDAVAPAGYKIVDVVQSSIDDEEARTRPARTQEELIALIVGTVLIFLGWDTCDVDGWLVHWNRACHECKCS